MMDGRLPSTLGHAECGMPSRTCDTQHHTWLTVRAAQSSTPTEVTITGKASAPKLSYRIVSFFASALPVFPAPQPSTKASSPKWVTIVIVTTVCQDGLETQAGKASHVYAVLRVAAGCKGR